MKQLCVLMLLVVATPALAQTPQGSGPPSWNMGYRIDLGVWHGLKLDTSDNLYVNCVAGCSGGGGGGGGGIGTVGTPNIAGGNATSAAPSYAAGAQPLSMDLTGNVRVNLGTAIPAGSNAIGSVTVSNFPATQPVTAASLPLPSGAATAANQVVPTAAGTGGANAASVQGISGGVPIATADANGAAFQGVVSIIPGTAVTAARSVGFLCTGAGNITLTLADTSTITLPIQTLGGAFQSLPFAVTNVSLGSGAAGTFWNLK